ncbi:Enoyl-CoA delta isomerase 1, mitochondrial [Liparis tanakae]|uniref:Enoyl-CoA delta isomerase 1, mitochondrial n=1 Tax=Liparis tanakae TaxID=230148 RepID=A0A4Z2ER65_9TELE|nr:Enoyl-CoA delta isomerase 1, mitochondrial [Liparis tanakae]
MKWDQTEANRQSESLLDHARALTKSMMRKPTIEKLTSNREADIQHFVNFITKDSIQKSLGMYMAMLKKRRG